MNELIKSIANTARSRYLAGKLTDKQMDTIVNFLQWYIGVDDIYDSRVDNCNRILGIVERCI